MESESKSSSELSKQIKNYEFCRRINTKNKESGNKNISENELLKMIRKLYYLSILYLMKKKLLLK